MSRPSRCQQAGGKSGLGAGSITTSFSKGEQGAKTQFSALQREKPRRAGKDWALHQCRSSGEGSGERQACEEQERALHSCDNLDRKLSSCGLFICRKN
jgi:hypothetical protein